MKKIFTLLNLICFIVSSFGQNTSEKQAVKNTLRLWYNALAVNDTSQFRNLVTSDFYIFEDGKRYNADELLALSKSFLSEDIKPSWTFDTPPTVEVDSNAALATFTTYRLFEKDKQHRETKCLESAVLQKENGRWQIAFFHSTPMANPEDVAAGNTDTVFVNHIGTPAASPTQRLFLNDAKAVEKIIRAFYQAERTGKTADWRALQTSDYYMFHEGIKMSPDSFAKFIDRSREMVQKYKAVWTMDISDLRISVEDNTAFTTQIVHNVEDANIPKAKMHPLYDETFLESFWLRKMFDGWKIAFWNVSMVRKKSK